MKSFLAFMGLCLCFAHPVQSQEVTADFDKLEQVDVRRLFSDMAHYNASKAENDHFAMLQSSYSIYNFSRSVFPDNWPFISQWGHRAMEAASYEMTSDEDRKLLTKDFKRILKKDKIYFHDKPEMLIKPHLDYARYRAMRNNPGSLFQSKLSVEEAIKYAEIAYGTESLEYYRTKITAANINVETYHYDEAEQHLLSLITPNLINTERGILLGEIYFNLGRTKHEMGSKRPARDYFKKALDNFTKRDKGNVMYAMSLAYLIDIAGKKSSSEYQLYAQQLANWRPENPNQMYQRVVYGEQRYPGEALRKGISGYATVSFIIDKDGSAINPKVIDASHEKIFDKSAIEAVLQSRFVPQYQNGKPVKREVALKLDYYTTSLETRRR